MKRFAAVFVAIVAMSWVPALAADSALSVDANAAYLAAYAKKPRVVVRPDGLMFKIIQNGYGKRPADTDTVVVYYTGELINGEEFDGTEPGLPTSFQVNGLIAGWSEALKLMREGDHWQIVIPATLGYGARGAGDGTIPPNQTLVFDLRLLKTVPAPKRGEKGYIPDPNDKDEDEDQQ
ncbi:MAG TPA: FKBP-type peptidyl-prolyl cis-trans isomerase [Rhizomicrobium sp.]